MPNLTDHAALEVSVLGAISINHLPPLPEDLPEPSRIPALVSFVTYLALEQRVPTSAADAVFFAGQADAAKTRRRLVGYARKWLGEDRVPRTLHHTVEVHDLTTDWHRFQQLHQGGDDGAALRLVRAQPMLGVGRPAATWVDTWQAQMIATIHQTGLAYGRERLRRDDFTEARIGIAAALAAEPASVPAYRMAEALGRRIGDEQAVARVAAQRERLKDVLHTPKYA